MTTFVSKAVSANSRPPLAEGPSQRRTMQQLPPLALHSCSVTGSRFEERALSRPAWRPAAVIRKRGTVYDSAGGDKRNPLGAQLGPSGVLFTVTPSSDLPTLPTKAVTLFGPYRSRQSFVLFPFIRHPVMSDGRVSPYMRRPSTTASPAII